MKNKKQSVPRQEAYIVTAWEEIEYSITARANAEPKEVLDKLKQGIFINSRRFGNLDDITIKNKVGDTIYKSNNVISGLKQYLEDKLASITPGSGGSEVAEAYDNVLQEIKKLERQTADEV